MKILGINCSPRKGQSTQESLEICLQAVHEKDGAMDTQIIELAEMDIRGCRGCGYCKEHFRCVQKDDFNSLIPILRDEAIAGMVIATPVYLGTMTSQCKAFLDRTVLFRRQEFCFRNKVAGVLAVGGVRNGGQELTIQGVQAALMCHDMVCVGDGCDTSHFGATVFSGNGKGVEGDSFGLQTARNLGRRVAELARRLHG